MNQSFHGSVSSQGLCSSGNGEIDSQLNDLDNEMNILEEIKRKVQQGGNLMH